MRRAPILLLLLSVAQAQPQPRLEVGFHSGTITAMALDSAERYLVTAADDQTVRVWDLSEFQQRSLRQLRVLRLPAGAADDSRTYTVAITPDGSTIAASSPATLAIYLFDRESGRMTRAITGLPQAVLQLAYSPDGRYLAAVLAGGEGLQLYRTADSKLAAQDKQYQGNATSVAFSPAFARDGWLATTAEDLYVRLYQVRADARLQLVRRRIAEQKDAPVSLAFSPDGKKLTVSLEYPNGYPEVEVWNPANLARLYLAIERNAMGGVADTLAWSNDGRYLYFGGTLAAGSPPSLAVRVGHGGTDPEFQALRACGEQTDCYLTALLPLRSGAVIFASANRHGLGILDADWKLARYYPAPLPEYRGLGDYGRFLVSADGMSVRFAYRQDGAQPAWFSVARRMLVAVDTGDGLSGAPPDEKSVDVHGLGTSEVKINGKPLDLDGETGMRAAAVTGRHRVLVATDWSLFLFDDQGAKQWKVALPMQAEAVNASANGRFAVAALIDGTIRWFAMRDGSERLALFPHPDAERWILWTPRGEYDCSSGGGDLLGLLTNRGEAEAPQFDPASILKSKFYRPDAGRNALREVEK